jgi:hypothetical protein
MRRRIIALGLIAAFAIAFIAFVPIYPAPNSPFPAGFFPRTESLGCAVFGVGYTYGQNSFAQMHYILVRGCWKVTANVNDEGIRGF